MSELTDIHVLHVDDDLDFAELASAMLERENSQFTVETATSTSEALDRLVDREFDCVVSDYDMPKQNGIEFLETVREESPDLPFILYTGKGSEEIASDAISAGATDYLQKSGGIEQYELLANRIQNAVEQHWASQRAAELNRVRTLRSDINQALVRADSRSDAEARICEILSDSDPYQFAWIGEVDPDTNRIEPRAWAGIEEGYVTEITVTADDTPTGRGPGGTAIRERRIAVSQNVAEDPEFEPWRDAAFERGYQSVAAVPLEYENTQYGELVVYADRPYAFDEDEQELLSELGVDIAHAFHSIDVRNRLREERDRRQALFKNAPGPVIAGEIHHDGDEHRITDVNDAFEEVFGYEATEVVGKDIADVVVPVDRTDQHEEFREQTLAGQSTVAEVERMAVDGLREFLLQIVPYGADDGRADGWYAWHTDITERGLQESTSRDERGEVIDADTVFTNLQEPVFAIDTAGDIVFATQRFLSITQLSSQDIYRADYELVEQYIEAGFDDLRDAIDATLRGDIEEKRVELSMLHPKSAPAVRRVPAEARVTPITVDNSRIGALVVLRNITERKAHERDLQRSHRRFEAVFNSPKSFMAILDPDGTVQKTNETALDFANVRSEDVTGDSFWETPWWNHSTELQTEVRKWIRRAANGEHVRFEASHHSPDGEKYVADGMLRPVTNEDGQVVSLIAEARDITERNEHEQAIKELHKTAQSIMQAEASEAVADIAVNAAHDILDMPINGVFLYDEDENGLAPIAWTNRSEQLIDEMPTFTPGEGLAWQVFESGEIRIYDDVSSAPERMNPDTAIRSELILPLGDHGILILGSPETEAFADADVSLARTLGNHATTALDRIKREETITDLHTATREMIRAESTQQVADVAVEAAKKIVGLPLTSIQHYEEDENILRPIAYTEEVRDLFGEVPTIEPGNSLIWRAFSSGEVEVHDDVREDPDVMNPDTVVRSQIILPLDSHGALICNSIETGDFDQIDVILARILAENTVVAMDRLDQEQALRSRSEQLEQQNDQLDQFAQVVSHDLRNPLNVAQGRVGLARAECESEHLEDASEAMQRMNDLINDLLALAREGGQVRNLEAVELESVVEGCWQSVETKRATLLSETHRTIRADPSRLKQLLENLFRNAVEHGGEDVTVTVGNLDQRNGFYVADDGPGIPEEEHEQVFDPGYSTADNGAGLGLNIVQEIVEAHEWDISVTDSKAGGARFEITGVTDVEE